MNNELAENLMRSFSTAIDQAIRDSLYGKPKRLVGPAMIMVLISRLLTSLTDQPNEARQEWLKITLNNLRVLQLEGGSSMSVTEPPILPSEELHDFDKLTEAELHDFDNLMGAFSFAIDKAMRDQLLDKPKWLRCQVMLTVLSTFLIGCLNECPTLAQKWTWVDLVMQHLRRLGPPEPE